MVIPQAEYFLILLKLEKLHFTNVNLLLQQMLGTCRA